ncbi:fatty-acid--CoA ligase [Sphingopyxis lindanitolerans]|uniref:3-methylmercaptopropionyl-CoA ligase n=1 Tax=Sphingopyxis lindanitolerans TaxID=2054227 RepID=A0A2S8B229_9SPHN|nr:long-chain fatty acid--CoA ligase [Sphingopyxis lindanitolerans]PQM26319.1 fatty-acid--CoA ligase [Sphingopyxis lindanitolerans]
MYLTQCVHRMIQRSPDATALVDGEERLSWAELRDRVARFADALGRLGVAPGDRVAMLARNGNHYAEYLLGTFWAGGVITPVNTRWSSAEIAFSLVDCEAFVLIVEPCFDALIPHIRSAAPHLRHIVSTGCSAVPGVASRDEWLAGAVAVPDAVRRGDALAAVMYTGGTTGRPKGVMLAHASIGFSLMGTLSQPGAPPGKVFLHSAPLFHIGGLAGLLLALFAGASCVFLPAFDPLDVLKAVEAHRVTDIFLVPTMLRMVADHPHFADFDTSSVRLIRYGASTIDETLLARLVAAFPQTNFCQAYGMTELSPTCCLLAPADHGPEAFENGRARSAGRATSVCEVRIIGDDGAEMPRGRSGEVVVRGPNVMLGYWGRPEETAAVLRDGWMHTGDVGRMDADGYVTIVDRLKDMIVTGGENVYSAEVENILSTHPGVAALAVIGIADETWGERVHAVVVPKSGASVDLAGLQDHCRPLLAGYKLPRSLSLVDALPLSGVGKILKTELRERYRAA